MGGVSREKLCAAPASPGGPSVGGGRWLGGFRRTPGSAPALHPAVCRPLRVDAAAPRGGPTAAGRPRSAVCARRSSPSEEYSGFNGETECGRHCASRNLNHQVGFPELLVAGKRVHAGTRHVSPASASRSLSPPPTRPSIHSVFFFLFW